MRLHTGRILFAMALGLGCSPTAAALASGTGVTGTVTNLAGQSVAGITVQVGDIDGSFATSTTTDAAGGYAVGGLSAGRYAVSFGFASGTAAANYAPQTDFVDVADGVTSTGVDARLGPGGELSGTATSTSGQPIAGLDVTVGLCAAGIAGDATTAAITETDADGDYAVYGLGAGSYSIGFSWLYDAGDGVPQFYGGTSSDTATCVPVASGAAVSPIDVRLADSGRISGVVTDDAGQPVAGQIVFADGAGPDATPYTTSFTRTDGSYELTGLGAGQYVVGFAAGGFPTTYYTDRGESITGKPLTVTAGATTGGIDETLEPAGQISGTITGPGGAWLDSAGNQAATAVLASVDGRSPYAYVEADGSYTITDVPPGLHTVEFSAFCAASPYATQFLGGVSSLAEAQQVDVSPGITTTGVDAEMQFAPASATPSSIKCGQDSSPASSSPAPTTTESPASPSTARAPSPRTVRAVRLSVTTRSVRLSASKIAAIGVLCGSASCTGTATVRLADPTSRAAAGTRGLRLTRIGEASFSARTARPTVARVRITAAGLRLLRADHGRATADVTVTAVEASRHEARTMAVVFRTQSA
ncbi:MAG TPA: carboxypeptidase-like regulatory domain-containing protein [Solirubrobacteraceae bacterium]|jgi:hypothetical protein|nr:carboxypeptidase-like regulatory domain-containing protein [Solirubrobacteraceae bacterium]